MKRPHLKQVIWEWRGVWITTPVITIVIILLRLTGSLQSWEWSIYDQFMRLRPPAPPDPNIVIVGIDEEDVRQVGQAIIPDQVYATLLKKLKAMEPSAIGLDVYRDLPVNPGHDELIEVFKSTPNLIGIRKIVGDSNREAIDPPPELKTIGANDLIFDRDKVVRRALLSLKDENGKTIPGFAVYAAVLYLETQNFSLTTAEGTDHWKIGDVVFHSFEKNDGPYIQADAGGYQIFLNYLGSPRHFETVPMRDILQDRVPADWARDKIVFIGATGESSNDLFFTPYTTTPSSRMAGVEIHANIASQMITSVINGRPLIKTWADPLEWLWIIFWSGVGATITWELRYAGGVKSFSLTRLAGFILAIIILIGSGYLALLSGWWIPVVPPGLALMSSAIAITVYIARTAGDIRKTFGRYLTDEVVANLLENPGALKLGGEKRKITILTSDLRGFTALSERLPPEEVVKILNFYLGYMADIITSYQGTIDEFMGDGILVLFGAPTARPDDAQRAVACAVKMQLAMNDINKQMKIWELPPLEMGIGINTGEVVVGNIGSEKRTKYGVVGRQVNLTYRIESYTTGGQILISEQTLIEAGPILRIDGEKQVQPKGVQQPITIYDVGGIEGNYNLFIAKEEELFLSLSEVIPLQYTILEGKHIGENVFKGTLFRISAKGGEVRTENGIDSIPSPLTNIKINLLLNEIKADSQEDLYAKVLENPADHNTFYIRFTSKPPAVEQKLNLIYETTHKAMVSSQ